MVTKVRFAQFNISLSLPEQGAIKQQLLNQSHPRFKKLASIILKTAPDVLLLCEFDHPGEGGDDGSLDIFCRDYLTDHASNSNKPLYPYAYCPPSNTGLLASVSLHGEKIPSLPDDGIGFGFHHGHFSFVLLSKYPIDTNNIRSWQKLLWKNLPSHSIPENYYSPQALNELRLSSKNHCEIPITINDKQVSVLASHPTPPVFDGIEQRNKRRNKDELKLIHEMLDPASSVLDDSGRQGGLRLEQSFVIMGDLNADPINGDGETQVIRNLLSHKRVNQRVSHGSLMPKSKGAVQARVWQPRKGERASWTHINGLRLDYVLPSTDLNAIGSGVFWPAQGSSERALICDEKGRERAQAGSDHRLVWVDIEIE
ncbi:endonuclease/exonuclease/phosphatase family protein [Vibrio sp. Of7-15]|uniref:endonuclease/exonuclease/phosphatase family protein n=1 Tax=Vibrio sp. Of7-15 TaxID=2724879 RepID=UPI001EF2DCD0|nr:endonuclease/exonuclease/phosphatase family protein [Vibrio sp. Of7-15]